MRSIDDIILMAREISRNTANPDGTFAISTLECQQYANDAQDRIQNLISAQKNISKIFSTDEVISLVAGQAAYSVTDRVLLHKQIEQVEFSATGLDTDYIPLEKVNYINRDTNHTNFPHSYFKRGNQILLQPTPSVSLGTIRVTYEKLLDDLSISIGNILSNPDTDSLAISLPLSDYSNFIIADRTLTIEYLDGTPMLQNAVISTYTSSTATTGVIQFADNVDTYLVNGYVIADLTGYGYIIGDHITKYSKLPDDCERYLVHYIAAQLFKKDSSKDYEIAIKLVSDIENDILAALKAQTAEIQYIPQLNRYEWW